MKTKAIQLMMAEQRNVTPDAVKVEFLYYELGTYVFSVEIEYYPKEIIKVKRFEFVENRFD